MAGKSTFKAPDLQNPDKLGKPLLKAFLIHLGRLGEIDAQVAADVIRYVVDADPEEVLLKLGGLSEADKELLLAGVTRRAGAYARFVIACKERLAIVRAGEKAPPSLWIRLGQVFEAVCALPRRRIRLRQAGQPGCWHCWARWLLPGRLPG